MRRPGKDLQVGVQIPLSARLPPAGAHLVLGILRAQHDNATILPLFRGMNPLLGDRSPARVLREDPEAVLAAARG